MSLVVVPVQIWLACNVCHTKGIEVVPPHDRVEVRLAWGVLRSRGWKRVVDWTNLARWDLRCPTCPE